VCVHNIGATMDCEFLKKKLNTSKYDFFMKYLEHLQQPSLILFFYLNLAIINQNISPTVSSTQSLK
jgi:hypothetical protein